MHSLSRNLSAFAALLLITLIALPLAAPAQDFTVLHYFDGANGSNPQSPPVLAGDGNVYGAAGRGGANSAGLIYKLTPQGELSTLYTFCSVASCTDGQFPSFGPIPGKDGNLYGTTSNGGANNLGEVYKLTPGGTLTVLYSFCALANCADGWDPISLVGDGKGGFYGTTGQAGAHNNGTIFHLTSQGKLTTLYNFCSQKNCADGTGNFVGSAPIIGADGNIYGLTANGGNDDPLTCYAQGCGTVFEITPQGQFSTLHTFCNVAGCTDGALPVWMIQGSDGNFYGTTSSGGIRSTPGGTVFKFTPGGTLTTLYSFCAAKACGSGYAPHDLIQGTGGTLYGTTTFGGNEDQQCQNIGCGTIFSLTPPGAFESLHSFEFSEGYAPSGVVQSSSNTLEGTTSSGGTGSFGSIFSLTTETESFSRTMPAAGTDVDIRETNLKAAQ